MHLLTQLIEVITVFVLAHPYLSIYLMGSMIAAGIYYSLMSTGMVKSDKNISYLHAFLSSWLLVIVFLFGILKGFFGIWFEKNNNGGH